MKKAQTEIIGVAVIVVILVLGGLFMIKLGSMNKNDNTDSYTDPEIAQSLLNTMMNTKTEKNLLVLDVIKGCYNNNLKNDLCGSQNNADCCSYAYATMKNALDMTLKEWGREYKLTVRRGTDKRIQDIPEDFECEENYQPGFYPIPPPVPITVELVICK